MPVVKIEIAKEKNPARPAALMNQTWGCIQEVFNLAPGEKNISLLQHDPDFFVLPAPYKVLIQILMFTGRSKVMKRILYRQIVNRLEGACGIPREAVLITVIEQPRENWAFLGGIPGDEMTPGSGPSA